MRTLGLPSKLLEDVSSTFLTLLIDSDLNLVV